MKKLFTLVFAALMLLSLDGFSQGFTIKGSIDGVETGKVTLQKRGGEKFATGLDNGSFEMKGKIIEAGLFSLTVEGVRGRVSIFLENGCQKHAAGLHLRLLLCRLRRWSLPR